MKAHFGKALKLLKSVYFIVPAILVLIGLGLGAAYWSIPAATIQDGYLPGETRKLSVGMPITVRFAQSMDRESVEGHFIVKPSLAGRFEWVDGQTLRFIPTESPKIGERYTVTVGAEAQNWAHKSLGMDYPMAFEISGAPFVKFVSPRAPEAAVANADQNAEARKTEIRETKPKSEITETQTEPNKPSEELVGFVEGQAVTTKATDYLVIGPKQPITVMFDRPMRPLEGRGEVSSTPLLEIDPPVKGTTRWLGTTAFQFIPDAWTMATLYTLRLPKGIQALDGSATEKEEIWKLATEAPALINSVPVFGNDVFPVDGSIQLHFNQPMDLDLVKPSDNVLLYPSNDADSDKKLKNDGFFNTTITYGVDKDGKTDRSILLFKPEFNYLYNQEYRLVVKAGLLSAAPHEGEKYGQRALANDTELKFKTVKQPGIAAFAPANGETAFRDGYVWIDFDSPMTSELIQSQLEFSPALDGKPEIYLSMEDRHAEIWATLKPSTSYKMTFKAPFKDAAGNTSRKGFTSVFTTAPYKPYLNLLTSSQFGLFPAKISPTFPVKGMNLKTLDLTLCPLSEAEFLNLSQQYSWPQFHCANPELKSLPFTGALNQSRSFDLDLATTFGHDFKKGIYFFEIGSPEYETDPYRWPQRIYNVFMVSDTALTLKKSGDDLLVWATDLVSGKPVSRMELSVKLDNGQELLTGVTDGTGVFKITKPIGEGITVIGRKKLENEDRWALVSQGWDNGVQPWQFGANGDWVQMDDPRIFVFTDRPLYKGGDEVHFKGLYRIDHDAALKLPMDRKVRVSLRDPNYNEVETKDVVVQLDGSFDGSFTLSPEPKLGQYGLYAQTDTARENSQRFYTWFHVEEYKKPKFKVELLSEKPDGLLGDPIKVDLQASYYFGGSVQKGKVHWSVMRDVAFFDRYTGSDYFSFSSWSGFSCLFARCQAESRIVAEGDGVLDDSGRLRINVPTDQDGAKPGVAYLYTLNAEVQDADNSFVTGRQTFLLHPAPFYVGVNLKNYLVSQGDSALVRVISVDPSGKPFAGQRVELQLFRETWKTVKKQGVDGSFYEEAAIDRVQITSKTVATGTEPVEAEFPIDMDAEGGQYIVVARAEEAGRTALSETGFYVSSSSYVDWGASNNNRMELVPDKPEYLVGGKARVLVKSPFGTKEKPAKALVTYELGSLRHYSVVDLKSNSDFVEVPITADMVPNVYVTVTVMKDVSSTFSDFLKFQDLKALKDRLKTLDDQIATLKDESAILLSSTDPKSLNRNAILSKRNQFQIETLDAEKLKLLESLKAYDGREPKPVDFALIRPDFRMGVANLRVNRREQEIVVDIKTSKPSYNIGEPVTIEFKAHDYQNRPVPATLSLAVVDESLLALKANTTPNPLDYFFAPRSLQVYTSTNMTLLIDRVNLTSGGGGKGGDGDEGESGLGKKRGDFKDTAYYDASIKTDEAGYAKVSFLPPDNLTTWQIWTVAAGGKDKFGMSKADFAVGKPISLSPILPRFAVSGDTFTFGALAHNQTDSEATVRVTVTAPGLKLKGGNIRMEKVKAGGTARLDFEALVEPVTRDTTTQVMFASTEDTVVETLPLQTFLYPEVVATNGRVSENLLTEKVRVPTAATPGMGGLDLKFGGTLATYFLKDLKLLLDYPYGCAEQITSKIFPILVIRTALADVGQQALFEAIGFDTDQADQLISDTLVKLSGYQTGDGGYGFWPGSDRSNPMLTSYILLAQGMAKKAEFTVDSYSIESAQQYLWKALNAPETPYGPKLSLADRAQILWTLSESAQPDTGMALKLYEQRKDLPLYGQAFLLMDLENLVAAGQKSMSSFVERLKSEIAANQISDERTIHFEEKTVDPWSLNTNLRTLALILMSLNRDDPENPLLPNMVNYLTHATQAQRLTNSHEAAWTLIALIEYSKSHGEFGADFTYEAHVGGDSVAKGQVTPESPFTTSEASIPLSKLKGDSQLTDILMEKQGEGDLLYDMVFKYFLPNDQLTQAENGFYVERAYTPFEKGDTKTPTTSFRTGELYRGTLNLVVAEDMHYVVVEERLPAGFEAVNFDLDTTDTSLQAKLEESTRPPVTEDNYYWNNPLWYFNHIETRDDRVLLFADELPKGVYTYHFLVRAGQAGKYNHLPASATEMYFPEVFGRTSGEWVEVK